MTEQVLLSVVITAYTDARIGDIYELLDSVAAQRYARLETVFVAEKSRELMDKVNAYVAEKGIPNVRLVFNHGEPGLSAARNLGIREARGAIIAFVDDDVVLLPGWAEAMVRAYRDESVIGVTGPASPLWEDASLAWFPEEFYWIVSCTAWSGWEERREVRNAWGMNMSFRREAFDTGEYFAPEYGLHSSDRRSWNDPPSEDVDLSLRVKKRTGKRIVYVPETMVKHRVYRYRLSHRFMRQRAYSVGYQRRMLQRLYTENNPTEKLLNQEHQLLKRILTRLFPGILKGLFTRPVTAWRRLTAAATILCFVALGYYSHLFAPFSHDTRTQEV